MDDALVILELAFDLDSSLTMEIEQVNVLVWIADKENKEEMDCVCV